MVEIDDEMASGFISPATQGAHSLSAADGKQEIVYGGLLCNSTGVLPPRAAPPSAWATATLCT